MSEYQEYPYSTLQEDHTSDYIFKPILTLLEGKKDFTILDIGCGNGWLVNRLLQNGFDAYGIDASASGIEIARRRHPTRFFLQDITNDKLPEPLQNLEFNIIISTEVIEHLYNPKKYILFCKRILQKSGGGKLILTTPYHGYFKNLALAITGQLDDHFAVLWDGGHIKFWSRKTITTLLRDSGFTFTSFTGTGRIPYLWKSMIITAKI